MKCHGFMPKSPIGSRRSFRIATSNLHVIAVLSFTTRTKLPCVRIYRELFLDRLGRDDQFVRVLGFWEAFVTVVFVRTPFLHFVLDLPYCTVWSGRWSLGLHAIGRSNSEHGDLPRDIILCGLTESLEQSCKQEVWRLEMRT